MKPSLRKQNVEEFPLKTSSQAAAAKARAQEAPAGVRGGGVPDRNSGGESVGQGQDRGSNLHSDILSALSGMDADRERAVAFRTRRVVQSSMGVIRERDQSKSRSRALALAVTFVVILLITPHIWEATDNFIAGEHLGDPGSQLSLWACVLCPVILASALVVGWWRRNRS